MSKGVIMKIAAVILGVAAVVVLIVNLSRGSGAFDPQAFARSIPITCSESGETWDMELGRVMDTLYARSRSGALNPADGLPSAKADGRLVAFPNDRTLWENLVDRVNRERTLTASPSE